VGGLSQGVDDNGDPVFSDLEADATLVVAAHADGFLSGVRRVEALSDGTVLVVSLTSTDAGNVRTETHDTDEGAVTVEDDDSGFAVTLPGTLLDATGAAYDGPYTVLFATFKAHDDSSTDPLALSPGPLLTGADSGSTPDALQSLGMLYIELTADDTGAPLALGEPATVTRTAGGELPSSSANRSLCASVEPSCPRASAACACTMGLVSLSSVAMLLRCVTSRLRPSISAA